MAFRKLTEYEYLALAADSKTTTAVFIGARCHETDTGAEFIYDGSAWVEISPKVLAGAGGLPAALSQSGGLKTGKNRSTVTAPIANGESLSTGCDCRGYEISGIVMPAAWTAASLTFQGSHDGATYQNVYDTNGVEVTFTPTVALDHGLLADILLALRPWDYVKVRSGSAGTPTNQGAARLVVLALIPL